MTNASDAWAELSLPWQIAFEEAWMSWVSGSAGVGSVVIDADGEIVSRGRSRVFDACLMAPHHLPVRSWRTPR